MDKTAQVIRFHRLIRKISDYWDIMTEVERTAVETIVYKAVEEYTRAENAIYGEPPDDLDLK